MGPVHLHEVAFGEFPDANVDDPASVEPARELDDLFLRAVAVAGQGQHARARADLRRVLAAAGRGQDGLLLRSAAHCALASHRRQAGGHRQALADDGAAAALATAAPGADPRRAAAVTDALVGLAADHLGTGALAAADRLLCRAEGDKPVDGVPGRWWLDGRPALRRTWVRAEWHLFGGRGAAALAVADEASVLARDCPSARHRLKTDLLVAASRVAAGDPEGARGAASAVVDRAERLRQIPLGWAAAGLLIDVSVSLRDDDAVRLWTERRDRLDRWSGVGGGRPVEGAR
ncbi:hypothetical protein ACXVUM_14945 [Williamsia sp. SKLECPSW1]